MGSYRFRDMATYEYVLFGSIGRDVSGNDSENNDGDLDVNLSERVRLCEIE